MDEYKDEELRELEELEKEENLNEEINQETEVEDEEVEETLNDEMETEVENEKVEETEVENEKVEETEVENEKVEETEVENEEVEISEHIDTVYDKFKKRAVAYMMIYGILPKNYKYTEWNSDLQQKYLQLQYAVGCKVYKDSPDGNHDIFNYDKAIISKK